MHDPANPGTPALLDPELLEAEEPADEPMPTADPPTFDCQPFDNDGMPIWE